MQAAMMQVTTVPPHSVMPLRCSAEAVDFARMCDQGSSLLAMFSKNLVWRISSLLKQSMVLGLLRAAAHVHSYPVVL